MVGTYTCRGRVDADSNSNLIQLFDGRFDTAYRVIDFQVASADPNAADGDLNAKLTTEPSTTQTWNWDKNTEIAWAVSENRVTASPVFGRTIIDPDHLIVEDLYLQCQSQSAATVNYLITMEKYDITSAKGALTMVRNKSQGAD